MKPLLVSLLNLCWYLGIEKSSRTSQFVFEELHLQHPANPYHEQNTLLENTNSLKNVVNKIQNVVKQEWVRRIMNFWSNQQEWKEKTLIPL